MRRLTMPDVLTHRRLHPGNVTAQCAAEQNASLAETLKRHLSAPRAKEVPVMIGRIRSSRARYRDYCRENLPKRYAPAARRKLPKDLAASSAASGPVRERRRTFELIRAFWVQLRSHRRTLWVVLLTSAVATLVGLLPPYGMKVIFDNVFTGKPLPKALAAWPFVPAAPSALLWTVVMAMFASRWCRWSRGPSATPSPIVCNNT